MPSSATMSTTVTPGNNREDSFPDTVQNARTDEPPMNLGQGNNHDAPEDTGSGGRESMIPKLFPVYAFI